MATGDAERRKIERNLHDGAQQHLVALAVNLRLAKDMLDDDPEAAAEMLDALGDAVKDTIQELRDLAHGIYPPLLMDSGLGEALRAAANRSPLAGQRRGRRRSVATPARSRRPSTSAAWRRSRTPPSTPPTRTVRIVVVADRRTRCASRSPTTARASTPTAARGGHGFTNMSDRLGAIGGTVEWRSAPGEGTTIAGEIPL